eukprot:scaffold502012_cov52-Prasinocladus_malaysianus.AAC.2
MERNFRNMLGMMGWQPEAEVNSEPRELLSRGELKLATAMMFTLITSSSIRERASGIINFVPPITRAGAVLLGTYRTRHSGGDAIYVPLNFVLVLALLDRARSWRRTVSKYDYNYK